MSSSLLMLCSCSSQADLRLRWHTLCVRAALGAHEHLQVLSLGASSSEGSSLGGSSLGVLLGYLEECQWE